MRKKIKKILYYTIHLFFATVGAIGVIKYPQFSFYWWLSCINLAGWGGYLLDTLLDYLKDN